MNFYKRFIGDITAKTGGLSLARMGAYDRLLDHFYSTEQPIPPDEVYSICRAMCKADRSDVDAVLERFWDKTPQGYVQAKAEQMIAKARPLIEAARENGKKGGRPRKPKTQEKPSGLSVDEQGSAEKADKTASKYENFGPEVGLQNDVEEKIGVGTDSNKNNNLDQQQKPTGFFEETQQEPRSKASQSQSQISPSLRSGDEQRATRLPKPFELPDEYRDFCRTERPDLDPDRVAAKFADFWHGKPGAGGKKLDWLATWRNWVREERAPARNGSTPHKHAPAAAGIFGTGRQQEVIDV